MAKLPTKTGRRLSRSIGGLVHGWFGVVVGASALAGPPTFQVSKVANHGMPRDIVKQGARWNFGPGSLWTHQGWQYTAYWDDQRQVSVGRRELPNGVWSVVSLPGYERTERINRGKGGATSQGFGDGHEKVSLGISPDGVIHLAFDHHVSTLHYRSSVKGVANDPSAYSWNAKLFGPVRDNLGGGAIDRVTYPSFATDDKQFTLYLRLNGGSGNADSHLFDYADGRWITPNPADSKIIDKNWSGGDQTVNAYPHPLVIKNGRRHLTWCWRDTPDPKTCHDLCYAYSDDGGKTWCNNLGEVIGLRGERFITADSPSVAVWKIPPGSRFVNGGSMAVDDFGGVHVQMRGVTGRPAYFRRDPLTSKWSSSEIAKSGILLAGAGSPVYLVSDEGVWKVSAGIPVPLTRWSNRYFSDSKPVVDPFRFRDDGTISLIGQNGRMVTVIDFPAKR